MWFLFEEIKNLRSKCDVKPYDAQQKRMNSTNSTENY